MTTTAILTMVLICGLIWGGFATLLIRAVRSEGRKSSGSEDSSSHGEG